MKEITDISGLWRAGMRFNCQGKRVSFFAPVNFWSRPDELSVDQIRIREAINILEGYVKYPVPDHD